MPETSAIPDRRPRQPRWASAGLSRRARLGLLLAYSILIAAKMPDILLKGRFWAEEGWKFFANAWMLPWWSALLAPLGGYLNITANLAGVLAWHAAPLEWAPYASSLLALGFQLCPAILLLTSGIAWLEPPLVLVTALLLVLTVPVSEEIWLSSIGTQCHLTLCAALILAFPVRYGRLGAFRLSLLVLSALSGPGSWLLTPWFALRALLDRSWRRAVEAGGLGLCVLLQMAVFYSHEAARQYSIRPLFFLDVAFTKHVLAPFLGPRTAMPIAMRLHTVDVAGHLPRWPAEVLIPLLVAIAVLLASRREPRWLAVAAVTVSAVAYVGALGEPADLLLIGFGERYFYAPQALVALALLGCAATWRGGVGVTAAALTAWLLVVGVTHYFRPVSRIFSSGPSWRTELALHQRDPAHVIASWPPGWIVPMPPPADAPPIPPAR